MDALIPALYSIRLSIDDTSEALQAIPGVRTKGVSAVNVVRRKDGSRKDYSVWENRDMSNRRYAWWWADGIYFNVRLKTDRFCIPVLMGATEDGCKELVVV